MTAFLRLELDPEQVDGPFVTALNTELTELRCERCRTTWFDPVPGPVTLEVDAPEGSWDVFRPGVLPAASSCPLIVAPELGPALRARGIDGFELHPVTITATDGEAGRYDGPPWAGLWPSGRCSTLLRGDVPWAPCDECGRFAGEFAEEFDGTLVASGWDGSPFLRVPGWRHTTFVTAELWGVMQELGVAFLRAIPAS